MCTRPNCGEIRLIYRLTRTDVPETTGEGAVSPRLPMTLNVVLKAKGASAIDGSGKALTCAEIARRWLAAGELPLTGAALAEKLTAKDGPLDLIGPENIDAYRDQSSDRACAEIGRPRFSHRLSAEGVRLRRASTEAFDGSADGEPDRSRADFGGRQGSGASSRRGCSIHRAFQRARSRHDPDPGKISGHRRDRPDPGRIFDLKPAAGLRPRARRRCAGRACIQGGGRRRGLEESGGARHRACKTSARSRASSAGSTT